ncbi:MAG: hypothetical protein AAGA92_13645 [Planctomycetota bacterium]
MPCVHLKQLYDLCEKHQLRLNGSELVHVVCTQCRQREVCPSVYTDEYDRTVTGAEADEYRGLA